MRLFLLIACCLCSLATFSQLDSTWIHTYGGDRNDHAQDIINTFDGGFCVVGATSSFGLDNSQLYLLKLDSTGAIEWSRTYGGPGVEWGNAVIQTEDSGYVAIGYTNSYGRGGYDLYLLKVNSSGSYEWDFAHGGEDWDFGNDVVEIDDGRYVLVGETYSSGAGDRDAWFLIYDEDEDPKPLNDETFGQEGADFFKSVIRASDGSLYAVGGSTHSDGNGGMDALVVRYTPNADLVWSRFYGDSLDDYANDIYQTFDFSFVFTGANTDTLTNESRVYTVKINNSGNPIWTESWNNFFGEGVKVLEQDNFNPTIYGVTEQVVGNGKDFFLVFMGFNGSSTLGSTQDDTPGGIAKVGNDNWALIGSTEGFNASYSDILFYKVDDSGLPADTQVTFFNDVGVVQSVNEVIRPEQPGRFNWDPQRGELHWLPGSDIRSGRLLFQVTDLQGRTILSDELPADAENFYSLGRVENGVYLISYRTDEQDTFFIQKMLIRR